MTLEDLALLSEFGGDPDATSQLLHSLEYGYPLDHLAQRIRQDRAEAADHVRLRADLQAAGIPVTDTLPDGAHWLTGLTHDGEQLTPETHAACPGRGATFKSWNLLDPCHYCTSPAEHGHARRQPTTNGQHSPGSDSNNAGAGHAASDGTSSGPDRRLVAGNKAWRAAAEVRHRWLAASLFARRSLPRQAQAFLAGQLLAMPESLRAHLPAVRRYPLFAALTGHDADHLAAECDTAPGGRLTILALAPVVAAYEHAMTEGEGRNTWRTDRYSPCPRAAAGAYLTFLHDLGYQLSDIEHAIARGAPFTTASPLTAIPGDSDDAGPPPDSTEPADDVSAASTDDPGQAAA
ncbi:MAG TPA: hypothetical protein VFQ44_08955 [Streptosporangiaceae bacterium]|nr:hypothetical protein [Streptosporangiaceae bacterium]